MNKLFFQILRIAIGMQKTLSVSPNEADWEECYDESKKQALVGVCFIGVQKLPVEVRPSRPLYLKWMGMAARIQQRNEKMNNASAKVYSELKKFNFKSCLLKGQGVGTLYGDTLCTLRQSGDIDIWVRPLENLSDRERRKRITKWAMKVYPRSKTLYHQISMELNGGIKLEIHYTPSWMNSPIKNRRLQRWFDQQADIVMQHQTTLPNGESVATPTQAFNEVFILQHIYRHLFGEGIGLRQVMDYYFVLLHNDGDNGELIKTLRHLGLYRFACALMWVMGELFCLPREKMICEPNEKEGRFILEEMMLAGNFGHYDKRIDRSKTSLWGLFQTRTRRNFRFIYYYPEEVICTPIFKIWHFTCRKLHII